MNKKLLIILLIAVVIIIGIIFLILLPKNKLEDKIIIIEDSNLTEINNNNITRPPSTDNLDYNKSPEIIIDSNIILPSEGNELLDSPSNQLQDNRNKGQTKAATLGATCGSKNKGIISESIEVPGQMLVCRDMTPAVPRYVWQLQ